MITNGGYQITTQERYLENFVTVLYKLQSLINILYLAEFHKWCRVTMDMETEKSIVIYQANGTKMNFCGV